MTSTQSTKWHILPTETRLEVFRNLLGKKLRVEGSWKEASTNLWVAPTDRFIYKKKLPIAALLVDKDCYLLGNDVLARESHLTLDLCCELFTPWPADMFGGETKFQALGAVSVGIRSLVLPTFASLDLGVFKKNLSQLENVKIIDTAPIYVEGSQPYDYGGLFFNDLHDLNAAEVAELIADDYEKLKSRTNDWLYGYRGWGTGNVCGSIDEFSPGDLGRINLYFTAAVSLDVTTAQPGPHEMPTDRLVRFCKCLFTKAY